MLYVYSTKYSYWSDKSQNICPIFLDKVPPLPSHTLTCLACELHELIGMGIWPSNVAQILNHEQKELGGFYTWHFFFYYAVMASRVWQPWAGIAIW